MWLMGFPALIIRNLFFFLFCLERNEQKEQECQRRAGNPGDKTLSSSATIKTSGVLGKNQRPQRNSLHPG